MLTGTEVGTTWHRIDAQREAAERDQMLVSRSVSCVPTDTLGSVARSWGSDTSTPQAPDPSQEGRRACMSCCAPHGTSDATWAPQNSAWYGTWARPRVDGSPQSWRSQTFRARVLLAANRLPVTARDDRSAPSPGWPAEDRGRMVRSDAISVFVEMAFGGIVPKMT
jgi:hypothetical protein